MGLPPGSTLPRSAYPLIFQGVGIPNIYVRPAHRIGTRSIESDPIELIELEGLTNRELDVLELLLELHDICSPKNSSEAATLNEPGSSPLGNRSTHLESRDHTPQYGPVRLLHAESGRSCFRE